MRKLFITGLVISGLVLAGATGASAQQAKCSKCESKEKTCKISILKKKVGLLWENKEDFGIKDDQLDKIKAIKHAAIKKLIQLKADKEIVMVDLKSAMYADVIDIAAVNTLIEAKYGSKEETAKTFVKAISDIQQVLSEDQRSQWKALCKKSKASCGKCAGAGAGGKFCPLTGKPLGN